MDPHDLFRWELAATVAGPEPVDGVAEARRERPDPRESARASAATDGEMPDGEMPDGGASTPAERPLGSGAPMGDPALPAEPTPGEITATRALPRALDEIDAPVLVHAMRGSMDAGHAGALVVAHLLATHANARVATFDIDELLDYRSRRPTMTFESSSFTDYKDPQLALDYLATDAGGVLLLHGSEPDLRWEAFTSAMRSIVERLGVRTTVGVHGIPMGIPHTRPISITAHATRDGLVDVGSDVFGTVQIPGSASSLLEYRLGGWGHDAMGFAVHVPHYLAQSEFPAAAVELVHQIARVSGAHLDVSALEEAAATLASEIDEQVTASPEVEALVRGLEVQYDAYQEAAGRSLLAAGEVPSGDELAARFEEFLAQQSGPDQGGAPEASGGPGAGS